MTPHVHSLSVLGAALFAICAAQAQQTTPLPPVQKSPAPTKPAPGQAAPAQPVPTQPAPAPPAPAQSAADVFEFHDLIGTFAINCDQQVGPRNPYAVYIAQGDGTVEFALMVGPTRQRFRYIIDWAEEIAPNEISFSMSNDETRINVVYLLDDGSIRAMESSREDDGEQLITNGYTVSTKIETQWFHKCE
jgi:hypothetical protein